jgi:hypothetical protein
VGETCIKIKRGIATEPGGVGTVTVTVTVIVTETEIETETETEIETATMAPFRGTREEAESMESTGTIEREVILMHSSG